MAPPMPGLRVGTHLKRYRQIVGILADEGMTSTIDLLGLRRFQPAPLRRKAPDEVPPEVHMRHAIERLGPAFIKIGQALSTRPDLIPEAYIRELRKLQDEVPPVPFEQVREVIETEFDAPLEDVFPVFDPTPIASASLGQVHIGKLADGSEVAIKVQRPGVRRQLEIDTDIFITQARRVAEHMDPGAGVDVPQIAQEFSRAVLDELDYTAEGDNATRLRIALADDDTCVFPIVHWEYTTSRVLTLQQIVGIPLNRLDEIDALGLDRAVLARNGIVCYLKQIFQVGLFHADPHAGNLFALPDAKVAFTDFGRVGRVSQRSREKLADLLVAAVDQDPPLAADALLDMSTNPGGVDEASLRREVARIIDHYHGVELRYVDMSEIINDVLGLIRDRHLGVPSDFVVLLATFAVLQGLGRELDPEFDFAEAAKPYAEELVRQRMEPRRMLDQSWRTWRRLSRTINRLPDSLDTLIRRAQEGELRMAVKPVGYDPLLERMREFVDRLSFALIVAAFVIGFTRLLAEKDVPPLVRNFSYFALTTAALLGTWFFIETVWQRAQQRRWRR